MGLWTLPAVGIGDEAGGMIRGNARTFGVAGLGQLLVELVGRGYEVYGPQVSNGVISHDLLRSIDDLPVGWTDDQEAGRYRLVPRTDGARFGYAVGPQSWKELLHPARTKVWSMTRDGDGELSIRMAEHERPQRAFLGVRPCELAAILKQDRILIDGPHPDPAYQANRAQTFIVVVNCGDPAATCFCPSMKTGPGTGPGYDIALTELVDGQAVRYVAEAGSQHGQEVLQALETDESTDDERLRAQDVISDAEAQMTRSLDSSGVRDLLYSNLESPRWDEVAERCLACGNCTLACPTCFCTDLVDVTDLSGNHTDRWRVWDSCFSLEFSHLGPGPHRSSVKSRYRQWLTHKLGGWIDQFDESGCVGCGRCITWCPVGIDLTDELAAIRRDAAVEADPQ